MVESAGVHSTDPGGGYRSLVQNFWRILTGLALVVLGFTILSWAYLVAAGINVTTPASRAQLLTLPTSIPSIWNIVHPTTTITWLAPFVVLLVQVFLTGGFYGTLVRANTGQAAGPGSFLLDAGRSFIRLFLWNVLWAGVSLLLSGIVQVFPEVHVTLLLLLLVARFLFLFVDLALVCERTVDAALRTALATLFNHLLAMLPYTVLLSFLTGLLLSVSASLQPTLVLLAGLLYALATTWILHMVVARYLVFSDWRSRTQI